MRLQPVASKTTRSFANADRAQAAVEDFLESLGLLNDNGVHWAIMPMPNHPTRVSPVFIVGGSATWAARSIADHGWYVTNCG